MPPRMIRAKRLVFAPQLSALLLLSCALLVGTGCSLSPPRIDGQAEAQGLTKLKLSGTAFFHASYFGEGDGGDTLHVYLEGDGRPWINETKVAQDPTSNEIVSFDLMALDGAPRLLLGRPCYFGTLQEGPCHPSLWTTRRYSETVIRSMVVALQYFLERHPYRHIVFIGHSGGGTLAMLMAPYFNSETKGIVTVAGNLDLDGWASLHNYTPLSGSLDPAKEPPLPNHMKQLHLAGAKDTRIPVWLIDRAVEGQPTAQLEIIPDADHNCCWKDYWPNVVSRISTEW